ncbi:YmdB family metallophosphoesterase [Patescibacteria group bacterium]
MSTIKILFLADIFGQLGRQGVIKILPELKKQYQPALTIANVENLAHGRGVTKTTISEMQEAGIDFFTSGNHIWDKKDGITILEQKDSPLIRPANYIEGTAGQGEKVLNIGENLILVINLIGKVFISDDYNCPFKQADKILKKYAKENLAGIIIDFHAEATSEKVALGHHLDGRVSAVLGTHTHIQTADDQILEKGTAYITDSGMIGPQDSVIGLDKKNDY